MPVLMAEKSISADATAGPITIQGAATHQTRLYTFKVTMSGTGTNHCIIRTRSRLNSEVTDDSYEEVDLPTHPPFVFDDTEVDAQTDDELYFSFTAPDVVDNLYLDFQYGGGGSRTFLVTLFTN